MRPIRTIAAAAALGVSASLAFALPGMAASPSGSSENKTNVVACNQTTGASNGGVNIYNGGNGVFVGPGGVEVCSDDDSSVDGRVILSTEGYGAVDGDDSNAAMDPTLTSWGRLDSSGLNCGGESDKKTEKENDATIAEGGSACGP